ncbi:DUF3052 family protein [Fibrella sp. WM1]|uniref:DUF3052 family protein n=1 Tax=Fibrella musci TaxID=3242485 RepID=UPI003521C9B6
MTKSISSKMGIKSGGRSLFINAPEEAIADIELPDLDIKTTLDGTFDYIHLFVTKQQEMHEQFAKLKNQLKKTGMLWVSWPKAGQQGTDLKLTKVIEIGYEYGLVESKNLSINATWSALKFTHPKDGKIYNNSYGKLKH